MNESPRELIRRALPLPGLAAWGVITVDNQFEGECLTDWLWPEQVEQLTRRLKAACATLPSHRLEASNTCWVYERARLYASMLPSQACVALIVENRTAGDLSRFQELLECLRGA